MLKVETDTLQLSGMRFFIADQLSAASKTAQPKDGPPPKKLIEGLKDWNGIADARFAGGFLLGRNAPSRDPPWFSKPYLGKETGFIQRGEKTAFLQKILTERPRKVAFPVGYKTYDEFTYWGPGIAR